MYGIYNENKNYVLALTNRSFTNTMRRVYVDVHRDEFTDEEYLLSQYRPFHQSLFHQFVRFDTNIHSTVNKICITRNPYTRALSSFYWFCKKRKHAYPKTKIDYNFQFNKMFKTLNFENFLNFLDVVNPIDGHLNLQTHNKYKFGDDLQLCKFGELSTKLTEFYVSLGLDYDYIFPIIENASKVKHNTSGIKKHYSERREYHKLSDVEILNMQELPDLRNMLTPTTEELIYGYFKYDFELLGYERYNISE
jgi:hypothetical protein